MEEKENSTELDELTKEALSYPTPKEDKIHFPVAPLVICGVIIALMIVCVIVILLNR